MRAISKTTNAPKISVFASICKIGIPIAGELEQQQRPQAGEQKALLVMRRDQVGKAQRAAKILRV